jgi:hypothetical protein
MFCDPAQHLFGFLISSMEAAKLLELLIVITYIEK